MSDDFAEDFGADRPVGEFDAAEPVADGTARDVAAFCRRVLREDPVPGLSVAVVRPDGEAYADAFGSRDLAGNRAASPDTLYGVGSVTKSITATAVLQLAETGLLSVDDPIEEHLDIDLGRWDAAAGTAVPRDGAGVGGEPDGAGVGGEPGSAGVGEEPDGAGDANGEAGPITVRHLLTHTSGFPSLGVSEALLARRTRRGEPGLPLGDAEDFRAHVEGAVGERAAPPGERWAYCNAGYSLLGELVAAKTGVAFADYVADHVFEPLEMDRTTFDDGAFARDADAATLYLTEEGDLVPTTVPTREASEPAGGALTSVRELGNYLRCQLNGGAFHGREVLPADRTATLHAAHAETPAGPYGYGWRTRSVCGRDLVGHAGSIAVSSAYVGFCETEAVGVALAANASPDYSLAALGAGVLAILVGEDPDAAVPYWRRRRLSERLTGTYAAYRGVKSAAVERADGALLITYRGPLGESTATLVPDDLGSGPVENLESVRFHALSESGERRPAEFRLAGDGVTLLVDRWRLRKVSDGLPADEERSRAGR